MNLWSTFLELDTLYEAADQKLWSFVGKAEFFRQGRRDSIIITTPIYVRGVSEAEALNHVKFVIRQKNNLQINTRILLLDYSLKLVQPQSKPTKKATKNNKTVDNTVTQLSIDDVFKT
jgi:hypothetical protein